MIEGPLVAQLGQLDGARLVIVAEEWGLVLVWRGHHTINVFKATETHLIECDMRSFGHNPDPGPTLEGAEEVIRGYLAGTEDD